MGSDEILFDSFDEILPDNLIEGERYYSNKTLFPYTFFCLSSQDLYQPVLRSLYIARIEWIRSLLCLKTALSMTPPDLILIDEKNAWMDPVRLIHLLSQLSRAPLILLGAQKDLSQKTSFLKRAYRAGLHDCLFPPFEQTELLKTVTVLLRLQQ